MTSAPPLEHEPRVRASEPPSVPLPPSPNRRARARRRRARERRERVAEWVVGTLAVAVVLVVWAIALVRDGPRSPSPAAAPGRAATAPGGLAGATGLIVQVGPDQRASSIAVVAVSASGRGGHVILVPVGTMVEIPSFGLDAVGEAARLGGSGLLRASLENLLGVALDRTVVLDAAGLAGLVRPAGDLEVDVPERVEEVGPAGEVRVLFEQGPALLGPDDVVRFLDAPGEGNDLARLARHQAFWRAWLARLRSDPAAVPGTGGAADLLGALAGGDVVVAPLPVEAVDTGGGQELYRPHQAEVEALVQAAVPSAVRTGARPRVQVLNGTGEVGLAQRVTLRLVRSPLRARVAYTANAGSFDHDTTEIVFYDRADQALAERVRAALGVGRLVLSHQPLGIVDVTVVVGRDFR